MYSTRKRPKRSKVTFVQVETSDSVVIDKQLQSILKPLNFMQTFVFSDKYKIKANVVTPNGIRHSFLSLFGFLIVTFIHVYSFTQNCNFDLKNTLIFVIWLGYVIDVLTDGIGYFLNYYTNIKNRQNNVLLVLKLQNAYKILKIDGRKHVQKNWASIAVVIWFYIIYDCVFWYTVLNFNVVDLLITNLYITFDINIIYASRLLNLLSCFLEMWIKTVNGLGYSEEFDDETNWIKIFDVFMNVFEAYQLIEETFKSFVSITFLL